MKITLNRKFQAAAAAETKTQNQDAVEEMRTQNPAVQMIQQAAVADQIMITTTTTTIMTMHTWSLSKMKMVQLKSIPS